MPYRGNWIEHQVYNDFIAGVVMCRRAVKQSDGSLLGSDDLH